MTTAPAVDRTPDVRLASSMASRTSGMLAAGGVAEVVAVRVLVVDDQLPFRLAMRSVVDETDGFEVVGEADSGEASVALAQALQPDLVLMDVNLPGIDGLEATRQLRSTPAPPVVILLSTYDEDAADAFVAESGAAAYVTKSAFGPDRLTDLWSAAAR